MRQWLPLLIAAIWLASGLGESLRELAIQHKVCPEHGEFIHVSDGDDDHRAPRNVGHGHCDFVACQQLDGPASLSAPLLSLAFTFATVKDGAASRLELADVACLRVAPKTSPPIA